MSRIIAIIPARAGSKGIPGKNIAKVLGHPLMAYSIAAGRETAGIDRVIVSTDSDDFAQIARSYGAEVPFLRPSDISQDYSPDRDFLVHALDWLKKNENYIPDLIVHLRPTTPIRDPQDILKAIKIMRDDSQATSLRSAHQSPACPYKWFALANGEKFYKTIANEITLEETNKPRQAFPPVYVPNGYVDILRPEVILQSKDIHGPRIHSFITEFCHDLDDPDDLKRLENDLTIRSNSLVRFLQHKTGNQK